MRAAYVKGGEVYSFLGIEKHTDKVCIFYAFFITLFREKEGGKVYECESIQEKQTMS